MPAVSAQQPLDARIWSGLAAILEPPEKLLPSQWAERYRILSRGDSWKSGPWDNAVAPVLATIINLPFCCPQIRKINVVKAGQIGASEAMRNTVGYVSELMPDPAILTLPDKENGKRIFGRRILPLFTRTPRLRGLLTNLARDKKLTEINLSNNFNMRLAWSGSPAALASDPIRWAFNDEVDKYQRDAKEADPLKLIDTRTTTYPDSLVCNWSTPTVRDGPISQAYEHSPIKVSFFAPCPNCGRFQPLVWDRLKWEQLDEPDRQRRAAMVAQRKAAWYECEGCAGRILEHHRSKMLNGGYLGLADGSFKLWVDGRVEGCLPVGTEVGVRVHALHSLMAKHTFALLAKEIIEAGEDAEKLRHLRNSTQAEVFEQQISTKVSDLFSAKCEGAAPAKVIPRWALRLIMTVDTQKEDFWFVIRAWGYRFRSRRIHHGRARTFDELRQIAFGAYFPYEGDVFPPQCCCLVGIDSGGGTKTELNGSRTDEVYQFALSDLNRIKAIKGESEPQGQIIRTRKVTYTPPDRTRGAYAVHLHLIDRGHFQDLLDSYISGKTHMFDVDTGEVGEEVELFELNDVNDPEYNRQLASTHKVKVGKGRSYVEKWVTKTSGAADHLRDCEVYNVAMAHGPGQVALLPPPDVIERQRKAMEARRNAKPKESNYLPDRSNWLNR